MGALSRNLAGCATRGGRIPAVVFNRRATKHPAKIRAALRVGAAPAPRGVAGSLNRAQLFASPVQQKPIAQVDDETLILADQAEKALNQMEYEVGELLAEKYPTDKGKELANLLASGTWTHDYPITYERANTLGLRVQKEMPESVLHLMQLYPQPTRRQ